MRLVSTILSALSMLLLVVAVFYYVRSYGYYEGVVYFTPTAKASATAYEPSTGRIFDGEVRGRDIGVLSARGRLTFASISDPEPVEKLSGIEPQPRWKTWSHALPSDPTHAAATQRLPNRLVDPLADQLDPGAMSLLAETMDRGFTVGSGKTTSFSDPRLASEWQLPYWRITVPYWFVLILLAILPWRWFSIWLLVAKREREGRCLHCGHELGGRTTGPCPNCGREIER